MAPPPLGGNANGTVALLATTLAILPGNDDNASLATSNSSSAAAECAVLLAHDYVFDTINATIDDHHALLRTLSPWGVLAISLFLCFCGFYAMRLVVAITAFGAGALGVVRIARLGGAGASACDGLTLGVVGAGAACAFVAYLLTRFLSSAVGAAAACAVVATVFTTCGEACDPDLWDNAPRFLGFALVPFWTTMLVAAAAGALVARYRYREMLATVAAILGGYGAAFATRSLVSGMGHTLPSWGFVAALCAFGGVGLLTQYGVARYLKQRRREGGRRREGNDASSRRRRRPRRWRRRERRDDSDDSELT